MRQFFILLGLISLIGCGVPSNPEKEAVILLCEGIEIVRAANGENTRDHKREFYRVDGIKHTLQTWSDEKQSFGPESPGLKISPTEMRFSQDGVILLGQVSIKEIAFDRISGRVTDELTMSNGGAIKFTAPCKPVRNPNSAKKF